MTGPRPIDVRRSIVTTDTGDDTLTGDDTVRGDDTVTGEDSGGSTVMEGDSGASGSRGSLGLPRPDSLISKRSVLFIFLSSAPNDLIRERCSRGLPSGEGQGDMDMVPAGGDGLADGDMVPGEILGLCLGEGVLSVDLGDVFLVATGSKPKTAAMMGSERPILEPVRGRLPC